MALSPVDDERIRDHEPPRIVGENHRSAISATLSGAKTPLPETSVGYRGIGSISFVAALLRLLLGQEHSMIRGFSALSVMFLCGYILPLQAQAQTSCSDSSLNGTYFYVLSGTIANGSSSAPYAEFGKFVVDGKGGVFGQSTASVGGALVTLPFSGSYTVQGNCTGTLTLSVSKSTETITFQIVDGGQSATVAFSSSGAVVDGRAYLAASGSASSCGNNSLTGGYGYLLSGVVSLQGGSFLYSEAGQVVWNGSGGLTTVSATNFGSGASQTNGTGTYSIGSDCSGTAQVTDQNGTAHYMVAVVEGGNVLFIENDAGTTVAGTAQQQLIQSVLPQFAFGGGWYSALYFTNTNASSVSFPVNFMADSGTTLNVPGLGTSAQVTLAPNGSAIVEAPNVGSLIEGYASLALPVGVTGFGLFRQSVAGIADQEAVVPLSAGSATSATLAWDDTNYTTAVAIANPSSVPAIISITVWNSLGNVIGTSSLSLAPQSKTEAVLRSLPGLGGMLGNRGSATFVGAAGNVAVLGLRFNGAAFTSIPTVQR